MPDLKLSSVASTKDHREWGRFHLTIEGCDYEASRVAHALNRSEPKREALGLRQSGRYPLLATWGNEHVYFLATVDDNGRVEIEVTSLAEVGKGACGVEEEAREDVWAILDQTPAEVDGLRAAVAAGKIDGSVYTGQCACLVGTIAKVRGVSHNTLGVKVDAYRPAEKWFASIRPGDVPRTIELDGETTGEKHARIALRWIDEWTASRRKLVAALTPKPDAEPTELAMPDLAF